MIKTHGELAEFIAGKKVLHLNSLGKDCAVTLDWLNNFAHPKKIVSCYFEYFFSTSMDKVYLQHQRDKYPNTEFIYEPNPSDLTNIIHLFQSPVEVLKNVNHFDYDDFSMMDCALEIMLRHDCDYLCLGHSKYESVTRASNFHKKGLFQSDFVIYPLGLMTKKQILGLISGQDIKLHPFYKLVGSSPDYPSYYKMRNLIIANPEFKERVLKYYPLLALDEYRWEELLK